MKKRLIYLLLFSLFFIPNIVKADDLNNEVDASKKIYDYANLLSEDEENEIYKSTQKYIEKNDLDLIILTLDNNPYGDTSESTKTYAAEFYNNNNFGNNVTKDGVVVVIDKSSNTNTFITFGKADIIYDLQKVNSINNSISTFIEEKNYYQMIKVYITKLNNYAKSDEEDLMCNDENDNKYKCLVPKVDNSKKIYDYANLINDEDEEELFKLINQYIKEYNMDLVLVTINENPYGVSDYNSRKYAQDFYFYSNFGIGSSHDGLIMLIDMSNRYVYIATKGKAIQMYDDSRIDKITEEAYNYLKEGNYFEGYKVMIEMTTNYADNGVPYSNKYVCIDETGEPYNCKPKTVNWGVSFLIGLITSLIVTFVHTRKYRGIKLATNANTYLKDTNIDTTIDQFLTTFTSRVRRSHDSGGSGGGGHFGGSSTSHGSGGSFGGGGRHF